MAGPGGHHPSGAGAGSCSGTGAAAAGGSAQAAAGAAELHRFEAKPASRLTDMAPGLTASGEQPSASAWGPGVDAGQLFAHLAAGMAAPAAPPYGGGGGADGREAPTASAPVAQAADIDMAEPKTSWLVPVELDPADTSGRVWYLVLNDFKVCLGTPGKPCTLVWTNRTCKRHNYLKGRRFILALEKPDDDFATVVTTRGKNSGKPKEFSLRGGRKVPLYPLMDPVACAWLSTGYEAGAPVEAGSAAEGQGAGARGRRGRGRGRGGGGGAGGGSRAGAGGGEPAADAPAAGASGGAGSGGAADGDGDGGGGARGGVEGPAADPLAAGAGGLAVGLGLSSVPAALLGNSPGAGRAEQARSDGWQPTAPAPSHPAAAKMLVEPEWAAGSAAAREGMQSGAMPSAPSPHGAVTQAQPHQLCAAPGHGGRARAGEVGPAVVAAAGDAREYGERAGAGAGPPEDLVQAWNEVKSIFRRRKGQVVQTCVSGLEAELFKNLPRVLAISECHEHRYGILNYILHEVEHLTDSKTHEQLRRELEEEGIEVFEEVEEPSQKDAGGEQGRRLQALAVGLFKWLEGAWPEHPGAFKQLLLQQDKAWHDTALHTCCRYGLLHVLDWLLPRCDPDVLVASSRSGWTALHTACRSRQLDAAVMLLTHIKAMGLLARTVMVGGRELQASQVLLTDLTPFNKHFQAHKGGARLRLVVERVCATAVVASKENLKQSMEALARALGGMEL
ncbi:hypothetical protein HYH03_018301 [Edaphochlamys debaryana]|uniref:Uncharacterized protein n=1 Tax=Edaphochlamys debaryana TaxID=47281 RepID=A0A835XFI0_9CHLO|nr:hypothetical protein HYH03_018301 [Edaphochlamys debaryana]|eukprot:KAG2482761.1 hypothetical protein HYH03_018301 [Edaphochlamys debaryana]